MCVSVWLCGRVCVPCVCRCPSVCMSLGVSGCLCVFVCVSGCVSLVYLCEWCEEERCWVRVHRVFTCVYFGPWGLQVGGASSSGPDEIGGAPYLRPTGPEPPSRGPGPCQCQLTLGLIQASGLPASSAWAASTRGLAFQRPFQRPRPASQVLVQPHLFSMVMTRVRGGLSPRNHLDKVLEREGVCQGEEG